MTRVAVIADSHFDEHSRFEECVRVHDWIAEDIARRGVDLILHSGDVYERKSTPKERRAVAEWVQRVTENAQLIIVRGNHDAPGDLPLLERLETRHAVRVVEGAEVIDSGRLVVGCLAWPTKASVLALGAQSHAEGELLAGEALRNVLLGLGARMDDAAYCGEGRGGKPRILLAHAMVRGSVTSTGQPLVGCDLELGLDDLRLANADFYALGHIHKGQAFDSSEGGRGESIVYPGSPRRTAFGETEVKGYVIAEFDGAELVGWERVETPCAAMLLLEDDWTSSGWLAGAGEAALEHEVLDGAEVRYRFHVDADRREEAREAAGKVAADLLAAGAVEVKVEPVVRPVGMARAPEVAQATTLADKLMALWNARGTRPEEARAERLLDRAHELESEP